MVGPPLRGLGEFIREERSHRQLSLRQLAREAGVSNPYLSQIERGVRKPSAEILQQIARALRISVEALYVRAGFLDDAPGGALSGVRQAVLSDDRLDPAQKQALLELYAELVGTDPVDNAELETNEPEQDDTDVVHDPR